MADDLVRQVLAESVQAAAQGPDGPAVAERIGRRVGPLLAAQGAALETARALELDDRLPAPLLDALLRGLAAATDLAPAPETPPAPPGEPSAPLPPWAKAQPRLAELPSAARRAAHDLNQPLTVILGYAAILRRATDDAIRAEAVDQIAKEARKMSEIIKSLSRLARGLDAA